MTRTIGPSSAVGAFEECLTADGYTGFRLLDARSLSGQGFGDVEMLVAGQEREPSAFWFAHTLRLVLDRAQGVLEMHFAVFVPTSGPLSTTASAALPAGVNFIVTWPSPRDALDVRHFTRSICERTLNAASRSNGAATSSAAGFGSFGGVLGFFGAATADPANELNARASRMSACRGRSMDRRKAIGMPARARSGVRISRFISRCREWTLTVPRET